MRADAVTELKESVKKKFKGATCGVVRDERVAENESENKVMWYTISPIFQLYRLPNTNNAPEWGRYRE